MFAESRSNDELTERLLKKLDYPHPVEMIELIETHISWILLTGDFAYKVKKPVQFDFVDYSSLEKRKQFCHEEVELNRRFAAGIYLGVVPIVRVDGQLKVLDEKTRVKSEYAIVEYAVKMRQFPCNSIVALRLRQPGMNSVAAEKFGKELAEFHDSIERSLPTRESAQPLQIAHDAASNFTVPYQSLGIAARLAKLQRIETWTLKQAKVLLPKFAKRLRDGFVRRCHGDLHLKNMIQVDGKLSAFDGIEFNEAFQWTDVLSEIAFPVMDFWARGRKDLAWQLLNSYLETAGDFLDLEVLRFYLVYRAMVRVKVTCLNPANSKTAVRAKYVQPGDAHSDLAGPWDKYLEAAEYFSIGLKPKLAITHGLSGSGKSTLAMRLIEGCGGIRIRSDVERQRIAIQFRTKNKYSIEMTDWVYRHLANLTVGGVRSGFPIVVDATFLKHHQRRMFQDLASTEGVPYEIIDCNARYEELCRRIRARVQDPSEATVGVLDLQLKTREPLTSDEIEFVAAPKTWHLLANFQT